MLDTSVQMNFSIYNHAQMRPTPIPQLASPRLTVERLKDAIDVRWPELAAMTTAQDDASVHCQREAAERVIKALNNMDKPEYIESAAEMLVYWGCTEADPAADRAALLKALFPKARSFLARIGLDHAARNREDDVLFSYVSTCCLALIPEGTDDARTFELASERAFYRIIAYLSKVGLTETGQQIEALCEMYALDNPDFRCPMTLEIMRDPVRLEPCKHALERASLQRLLEKRTVVIPPQNGQPEALEAVERAAARAIPTCPCCRGEITNCSPMDHLSLFVDALQLENGQLLPFNEGNEPGHITVRYEVLAERLPPVDVKLQRVILNYCQAKQYIGISQWAMRYREMFARYSVNQPPPGTVALANAPLGEGERCQNDAQDDVHCD